MKNECNYCQIPQRTLTTDDYFEKMSLWREYVRQGIFKFTGGDTLLENFENEISKEEKYYYYHFFQCNCGNRLRAGVCIRSSVPVLEHLNSLNESINKRKTAYNSGYISFWQRIRTKFNL